MSNSSDSSRSFVNLSLAKGFKFLHIKILEENFEKTNISPKL
jgi:hypothetical protein